jgi:hypothetical protein
MGGRGSEVGVVTGIEIKGLGMAESRREKHPSA